jgi:hypothetical protein
MKSEEGCRVVRGGGHEAAVGPGGPLLRTVEPAA